MDGSRSFSGKTKGVHDVTLSLLFNMGLVLTRCQMLDSFGKSNSYFKLQIPARSSLETGVTNQAQRGRIVNLRVAQMKEWGTDTAKGG